MKQLPFGLVLEGSSSRSAMLRLPKLAEELGPIKSSAMRLARRFSNLIQAGYAVAEYQELQTVSLVLLRAPDRAVPRIVDELCASELVLHRIAFVLCETWLGTEVLEPLRERGAAVATLIHVPAVERNWFVIEGQLRAARMIRRLIERHGARAFEIKMGSKHLLFAAEVLSSVLTVPMLAAAQQALRSGGIVGKEGAALLQRIAERAVREVIQGVRLPVSGLPPDCSFEVGARLMSALEQREPALASFIQQQKSVSAKLINEAWKNGTDGA